MANAMKAKPKGAGIRCSICSKADQMRASSSRIPSEVCGRWRSRRPPGRARASDEALGERLNND
jgi:hypothetical protein